MLEKESKIWIDSESLFLRTGRKMEVKYSKIIHGFSHKTMKINSLKKCLLLKRYTPVNLITIEMAPCLITEWLSFIYHRILYLRVQYETTGVCLVISQTKKEMWE